MDSSDTIRQKARQKRAELGFLLTDAVPSSKILEALEAATGIARWPVPAGDALLSGAQAVLNIPMEAIFQDSSRPEQAQRFDAAHEYAHVFLHRGSCHCAPEDMGTDNFTAPAAVGADKVEGYSPRQRREREANVYAAELLMPDALLRRLFFDECLPADQIAERLGLASSLVLAQMMEVLLLPPIAASRADTPPPGTQAVTLDPFQRAAAEIVSGPLLLGAGPGTGKTKTLVGRCQYLVSRNVPPEKILCLTFSRDAAQEMRERLLQAGVGSEGAGPWVGTFHSLGLDILKRFGERIGLTADVRLLGTLDAMTLLENNLPALALEVLDNLYDPAMYLKGILQQISRAKDELCTPLQYERLCQAMRANAVQAAADFASQPGKKLKRDQEIVDKALTQANKAAEISRCYAIYDELMAAQGYLDFGDLVSRSVHLLETCPDVTDALRAEFPHVLADEYQDVNRACARLVRLLAGDHASGLWAVGDHRQSIYRFRGASPANIASFKADYPRGERLELGVNYRSHQTIVECFENIARTLTPDAELSGFAGWQSFRGMESDTLPTVVVATAPDDEGQASGIADEIRRLRPRYPYPQQAILCRTHAQAQSLVDLLTLRDVPVLYLGRLLERPEVKDLLCLLSLFSPEQGAELIRVGAFPEYRIPQEDVLLFLERLRAASVSVFAGLQDAALREGLSPQAEEGMQRLSQHLAKLDTLKNDPATLLRQYLFNQSQFLRHLAREGEQPFLRVQRLLAINQFYALTLAFDRRIVAPGISAGPPNRVREFLAHLRRQAAAGESPQGTVPEGAEGLDAVRILTAHKAKGLEYPVVFVPNLGRGQFPTQGRSDGLPEPPGLAAGVPDGESDEDLCLFFVALSRARDRLILSHAAASRTDREVSPSPLLLLLDAWLETQPAVRAEWPSGRSETTHPQENVPGSHPLPLFSASALETYARCPRQYYYERELKMPGTFLGAGYPRFHGCVRQTLTWMEDEQSAGRVPVMESLRAKLEEVWAVSGPARHLHEAKYKESALQMLEHALRLMEGREPERRLRLTATLPSCRVSVRPDAMQRRSEDDTLVLARRLTGKPGDNDARDKKLALLRRAASETLPGEACVLELHYLADGRTVEIPPPPTPHKVQLEADRLVKYDDAARGIRLRLFPARPVSADECQTCAYALVCPQ